MALSLDPLGCWCFKQTSQSAESKRHLVYRVQAAGDQDCLPVLSGLDLSRDAGLYRGLRLLKPLKECTPF